MELKTLVLGAAVGYHSGHVFPFVDSLRRYYQGDAHFLVHGGGHQEFLSYMRANRIVPQLFDSSKWMPLHLAVTRYVRYSEILRGCTFRYDRVLLTDVSDVLFQAHPFEGAPEGDLVFFMEDKRATIGSCKSNATWVTDVFGEQLLTEMADRPVACSGTTMGSHEAILNYIDRLLEIVWEVWHSPNAPRDWKGRDQAVHNYLLQSGLLPNVRTSLNGEWVYTLAQVPKEEIIVDGPRIATPKGKFCPIVHQWQYHPQAWEQQRAAILASGVVDRMVGNPGT